MCRRVHCSPGRPPSLVGVDGDFLLQLPPWRTALILLFLSPCRVGQCPGPDRQEPGQAGSSPGWQAPAAALPTLHQGAAHPHPAGEAGTGGDVGRTEWEGRGSFARTGGSTDGPGAPQVAGDPVLDSAALQFCARKVSAVSGDARKALDVCRSVCAPKPSQAGPCESPWLPCTVVPMPGVPALPGTQGCPSPGVLWRWWSWRCEARPC